MLRVSAAISLIIWLVPISALATTYYVAKTGSNTYSCTQAQSQTMAKQTIQAAVNCARIPGDTVIVKAGTYVESVTAGNSGLSGKPITLKANPGDTVTWTNVIRDPASFTGALNIYDRSYIRIEGFRFQGSRSAVTIHVLRTLGTKTTNPVQGIEIINNTFIDNGGEGSPAGDPTYMIFFSGVGRDDAYTGSTVNTITGSTLTNNWGPQIVLYATSDVYVAHNTGTGAKGSKSKWDNNLYIANYVMLTNDGNRRNLIAQNDFGHFDKSRTTNLEYAAIRGDSGASQNIIQNNILHDILYGTTFNPQLFAYGIMLEARDHDNVIKNNIVYNSAMACIVLGSSWVGVAERNVVDGNVMYQCDKVGLSLSHAKSTLVKNNILVRNGLQRGTQVLVTRESVEQGGHVFRNNLYKAASGTLIGRWNGSEWDAANLTLRQWSSQSGELNALTDDPLFVNPPTDFHLKVGSPARGNGDAGVDMGAYPRSDSISPMRPSR